MNVCWLCEIKIFAENTTQNFKTNLTSLRHLSALIFFSLQTHQQRNCYYSSHINHKDASDRHYQRNRQAVQPNP